MTDDKTPPDWVIIEAVKRSNLNPELGLEYHKSMYQTKGMFTALCDMIQKYDQSPEDRKLLCAREALREAYEAGECVAWTPE